MIVDLATLKAAELCRERNISFALYVMPGQTICSFVADPGNSHTPRSNREIFAVDFMGHFDSRYIIRDVWDIDDVYKHCSTSKDIYRKADNYSSEIFELSHEKYISDVNALIDELKIGQGKCVISQIFQINNVFYNCIVDLENAINKLFENNSNAFRALFYTSQIGCWIVASPELLLDADIINGHLKTMSLAGTRPAGTIGSWDLKNIREQAIVSNTIMADLQSLGAKVLITPTRTLRSNLVEHLCSNIEAILPQDYSLAKLLDCLSPTPAIAGFPRKIALSQIARIERHSRKLYGGYLGIRDDKRLFAHVTLRCAEFTPSILRVYAGSGITPDSIAEEEWCEINTKARQFSEYFK